MAFLILCRHLREPNPLPSFYLLRRDSWQMQLRRPSSHLAGLQHPDGPALPPRATAPLHQRALKDQHPAMSSLACDLLQPLGDCLAATVALGTTSAACVQALHRLLPRLRYFSLAVTNPAAVTQHGGPAAIVAAANCAVEGPTMLHLFDAGSSAAGLALARGRPLTAQLRSADGEECGTSARVLSALADVQVLAAAAPSARHVLCIPFGGAAGSPATHGPGSCQLCGDAPQGSTSGALLVGLEAAPQTRHLLVLQALARCLPRPLGLLSGQTLAFVNLACGMSTGSSSCCCCEPRQKEEEQEGPENEGSLPGSGGDDGASPSVALPVPPPAALDQDEAPGVERRTVLAPLGSPATSSSSSRAAPRSAFGKALSAGLAAGEGGEAPLRQSRGSFSFRSYLAEGECWLWMARACHTTNCTCAPFRSWLACPWRSAACRACVLSTRRPTSLPAPLPA